jgi:hypothetical protein
MIARLSPRARAGMKVQSARDRAVAAQAAAATLRAMLT